MAMGNFLGGVFQGGMNVWNQQQQDEKLRIEREKADRDSYEFDKVKKRDVSLEAADTEFKDATATAAQVKSLTDGGAATALTEQALKSNEKAVSENIPGETQAVAPTEEQKAGIAEAYKGYGGTTDGVVEGALAKERNSGSIVTQERQAEVVKKFGGIKPDEVNRYRLGIAKSDAFMSTHPEMSMKIQKEATEGLAGNILQAAYAGDGKKVAKLYNAFQNGHDLTAPVEFDAANGKVTFHDDTGKKTMDMERFVVGVVGRMDPKAAGTMLVQLRNQDLMDEYRKKQTDNAGSMIQLRMLQYLDKAIGGGGGGGGSGGTKKASGHSVVNGVSDTDIGREDYFKQFGVSGESGSPEARTQASTGYGFYQMMLKNDPSIGEHEAFRLSQNIAMGKAELLPNFDETTLSWRRGIKTETGNFHWVDSPGNKPEAIGVDPKIQLAREMQSPFAKEVMDDAKWANFEKAYATARQSGNKQQISELGNVILFGQRVRGNQKKPNPGKPEPATGPDRMTNIPGRIISSAIGGIKDSAVQAASDVAGDIRKRLNPSIVLDQELNTPIDSVIKR